MLIFMLIYTLCVYCFSFFGGGGGLGLLVSDIWGESVRGWRGGGGGAGGVGFEA